MMSQSNDSVMTPSVQHSNNQSMNTPEMISAKRSQQGQLLFQSFQKKIQERSSTPPIPPADMQRRWSMCQAHIEFGVGSVDRTTVAATPRPVVRPSVSQSTSPANRSLNPPTERARSYHQPTGSSKLYAPVRPEPYQPQISRRERQGGNQNSLYAKWSRDSGAQLLEVDLRRKAQNQIALMRAQSTNGELKIANPVEVVPRAQVMSRAYTDPKDQNTINQTNDQTETLSVEELKKAAFTAERLFRLSMEELQSQNLSNSKSSSSTPQTTLRRINPFSSRESCAQFEQIQSSNRAIFAALTR